MAIIANINYMHEGIPQEAEVQNIDPMEYVGVVVKEGGFYTADGVKLEERDGELYVAEGEDDAGTQILRNDAETIPSGY